MTEHDPQPGELWETDWTDWNVAAEKRDGVWYRPGGKEYANQDQTPIRLVGYTVEYVEKLRAERDADAAARDNAQEYGETVERRKDAQDLMWRNRVHNLQAQRDEAEAEVEALRAERDDLAVDVARFETRWQLALAEAERKPWEVLREAADIYEGNAVMVTGQVNVYAAGMRTVADRLEREAAEDARQKRRIEKAVLAVPGGGDLGTIRALDEAGLLKDTDDE